MIFCNLKVLMAERNISVSKMSEDTGISRTTITALCGNKSGGIQFDTLNTICGYLNVLPNEVILFSPHKIDFKYDSLNNLIVATVENLITHRKFSVDLIIEQDKNQWIFLNHFTCDEEKFSRFVDIIKELPLYYISYLNEQLRSIFNYNRFDPEAIKSFNILTDFD